MNGDYESFLGGLWQLILFAFAWFLIGGLVGFVIGALIKMGPVL